MADRNPVSFLLNQGSEAQENAVVEAPAFSLTKVLSAAAVIITPVATLLVDKIKDVDFSAWNYVVLTVGVLGFLAITASADVIGRSVATAAEKNANAALASLGQFIAFTPPIKGHRKLDSKIKSDPAVEVLGAAQAHEPFFLVKEGDSMEWKPIAEIELKADD
jgi:hypothetical protein